MFEISPAPPPTATIGPIKRKNRQYGVEIKPIAGTALLIEFEIDDCTDANEAVFALDHFLRVAPPSGVTSLTPAYRSLLLRYDPRKTTSGQLSQLLREHLAGLELTRGMHNTRRWRLPAVYGGAFGIDLLAISSRLAVSARELIARHQSSKFVVAMLGFQPGFTYLRGLDPTLSLPRNASPRFSAPPGTLKIGNGQAAIQSMKGPSGWHWIGRTPVRLFDPTRTPANLLSPGDEVTFEAITERDFEALQTDLAAGKLSTASLCDDTLH